MSLKNLARRLPSPIYRSLQRLHRRLAPPAASPIAASPGPLLTGIAPRIWAIPGWFNLDDLSHFSLVLGTQTASGMHGDLLEIGCYHGRSAAVLAMHLMEDERLYLTDAFDLPLDEPYGDTPTLDKVWKNMKAAVPNLPRDRIDIQRTYSRDLVLPADLRLRFAHIDGGHDAETLIGDLELSASRLLPGGILVVDDYAHPQYPGVTQGSLAFLAQRTDFRVLADLNRQGALGRKLYLVRGAD